MRFAVVLEYTVSRCWLECKQTAGGRRGAVNNDARLALEQRGMGGARLRGRLLGRNSRKGRGPTGSN